MALQVRNAGALTPPGSDDFTVVATQELTDADREYHAFLNEVFEIRLNARLNRFFDFLEEIVESGYDHDTCVEFAILEPGLLEYIPNPSLALYAEIIEERSPLVISHITNPSHEICMYGIGKNPRTLNYVENQTSEMCLFAISNDPQSLRYVKNQTLEICMFAISKDYRTIEHVQDKNMIVLHIVGLRLGLELV